ncbi:MAG: glycerophosphodiester phosphodiesterase family protein [Candidatus Poribacteria bacterium]|nr:glycerophosphodiester phosphodiesterase family protein [Candidatus Poribacteria bacterium]
MVYVVGHRGAASVLPENTLKGFRYAIEIGCDYTECDIHLTKDNKLVVMHDTTVDRTTNGSGPIADKTFAEMRALDAGDGEQVPTLDEVLATTQGKIILLCEMKGPGVEEQAMDAVRSRNMQGEVIFTSFVEDRIAKVKRTDEAFQTGAILPDPSDDDVQRAHDLGVTAVGVQYRNMRLRTIEKAHALGLQIRAWNPDELALQLAMIGLGVDGVSTNRPDMLIKHLKSTGERK